MFLAIQGTLELVRSEKDSWNPLIAGGWTGFIFGHGISKYTTISRFILANCFIARNLKFGLGLGLNGALITWALQSFTLPTSFDYLKTTTESFNPILSESQSAPLKERIETLKSEISSIKNS